MPTDNEQRKRVKFNHQHIETRAKALIVDVRKGKITPKGMCSLIAHEIDTTPDYVRKTLSQNKERVICRNCWQIKKRGDHYGQTCPRCSREYKRTHGKKYHHKLRYKRKKMEIDGRVVIVDATPRSKFCRTPAELYRRCKSIITNITRGEFVKMLESMTPAYPKPYLHHGRRVSTTEGAM